MQLRESQLKLIVLFVTKGAGFRRPFCAYDPLQVESSIYGSGADAMMQRTAASNNPTSE